ncbi:hypothetical protein DPMN_087862 [Dreissena polymorpha]|uniref:Uncharacterized protein n=2 Tax=Dreissena polymorpha TaxID=45954 RepID=A0A9D4QVW6_DREPO|nr:hypothetical protein DPMN_087862 [Dreissena polymorpha]
MGRQFYNRSASDLEGGSQGILFILEGSEQGHGLSGYFLHQRHSHWQICKSTQGRQTARDLPDWSV